MSRQEAKNFLVTLGIAEPTDEQITNYLNQVQGETAKERTRADRYKADADKVVELQKQLDEKNQADMSEVEKTNALLEKANNRIAELEKASQLAEARNNIATKFKVTAEQAQQIMKDDGSMDYDVLAKIISDKELASANAKEQEIAGSQGNPGGGSSTDDKDSPDVENAKSISFAKAPQDAQKAVDYYSK